MASTASEYLAELIEEEGDEFWAEVIELAGSDWAFPATEMPEWLREAAFDALTDTFDYDYWLDVPSVTRNAVLSTLKDGIQNGLSIRSLAEKIREDRGEEYAKWRATNTARTETTGAMNRGHVAGMEQLAEETGLDIRPEWMSVLGTTTRPSHANADGQKADEEGLFTLVSDDGTQYRIPYPGHPSLPAKERCNCQCGVISSFAAEELEGERDVDVEIKHLPGQHDQSSHGSGGHLGQLSPQDAERIYDATEDWMGELDEKTAAAVDDYIGDGHASLNLRLRMGGEALTREDKQTARAIDDAMVPIQGDAVLFRGVGADAWSTTYANLKPGDVVSDKAFMSTSMERASAEKFAAGGMVEIAAPKGTMCLPVAGIGEMEILLPRGMEMRVVAVDSGSKSVSVVPIRRTQATVWQPVGWMGLVASPVVAAVNNEQLSKHLQGQHNQQSHGHGSVQGTAALEKFTKTKWSEAEVRGIAGAGPGADITVEESSGVVTVEATSEAIRTRVTLYPNGRVDLDNMYVDESHQGKGLGTQAFKRIVDTAAAKGMRNVTLVAVRSDEENGYYTWPRLGCDGPLPRNIKKLAERERIGTVSYVSDLMTTKEGRDFWKKHGVDMNLSMELGENSSGRKILDQYVTEARSRGKSR